MKKLFDEKKEILGFILIFGVTFLFFFYIHPITLSDTDDWLYAAYARNAIPEWKGFNPTRVFAETWMTFISQVGAYIVYPLFGSRNIFESLSFVYSFFLAMIFSIESKLLYDYLNLRNNSKKMNYFLVLYFILCHFWIFRNSICGNKHLLFTNDACTFFYYVIPNLLNVIFILDFYLCNGDKKQKNYYCIWIVVGYFCIFSNIWASIILATYVGVRLLADIVKRRKIMEVIMSEKKSIIILMGWGVQQIFEIKGGRSAQISGEKSNYYEELKKTLVFLKDLFSQFNSAFLITFCIVLIIGIAIMIYDRKINTNVVIGLSCSVLILIYAILSCSKAFNYYITRPDVIYGAIWWLLFIELIILQEMFVRFEKIQCLFPLFLIIVFFNINTTEKTFLDTTMHNNDVNYVNDINNSIINQLKMAEYEGKNEIVLYVPDFGRDDNWPYAIYAADRFPIFAKKYKLIHKNIYITEMIMGDEWIQYIREKTW